MTLSPQRTRAFTLVELMISIALVLLLVVGINQVFRMAGQTVAGGMAMSQTMREHRDAYDVLKQDFAEMAPPGQLPFLILSSQQTPAFQDAADEKSNLGSGPLVWQVDASTVNNVSRSDYGKRNHRVDQLSFFTQGQYRRETGVPVAGAYGSVTYQSQMTAPAAWVTYGHLRIANNNATPTYYDPGQADVTVGTDVNDNNRYSSSWILGRSRILLTEKDPASTPANQIFDLNGYRQLFFDRYTTTVTCLSPLSLFSQLNNTPPAYIPGLPRSTANRRVIQDSLCDLAATSLPGYRLILARAITNTPALRWWDPSLQAQEPVAAGNPNAFNTLLYRFYCNPFISKTNVLATMADNTSLLNPIFIPGCSQFVVEYAGDYLTRDPTSHVVTAGPDGKIDTIIDPVTGAERIRWYGLPRNVAGAVNGGPDTTGGLPNRYPLIWSRGVPTAGGTQRVDNLVDVLPLADVLYLLGTTVPAPFEKNVNGASGLWAANSNAGGNANRPPNNYNNPANPSPGATAFRYTCAWGPNELDPARKELLAAPWTNHSLLPWLIRITIRIDDSNGRLPDGQTLEYIFALPHVLPN